MSSDYHSRNRYPILETVHMQCHLQCLLLNKCRRLVRTLASKYDLSHLLHIQYIDFFKKSIFIENLIVYKATLDKSLTNCTPPQPTPPYFPLKFTVHFPVYFHEIS